MFFNLETGEVINKFEMRKRYPKISFPSDDVHKKARKRGLPKPKKVRGNGPKKHIEIPGDYFVAPDPWVPFIPDEPPPHPEPLPGQGPPPPDPFQEEP
jgi:hypothetical protein